MAEALLAVVGAPVAAEVYKDGRSILNRIRRRMDLWNDLEHNYKRLKEEAGKLSARRNDIENEANRYKTKQFTEECKDWISRVKDRENEVQELETKYNNKYTKRKAGVLKPFATKRINLSKCMEEKCVELQQLWSKGEPLVERVPLVEKPPERVTHAPETKCKPSSLHRAVEEILRHLKDPNVRKVGLWGMAGVGKTAIMETVNNNAHDFEIVILLTVSKDWSIKKLQQEITQRLKLNVEGIDDPVEIAHRISVELEGKKYLLLLDEVWNVFKLRDIGIQENQKDSKVVLATRNYNICAKMNTDDEVHAQLLSENDAYLMFLEEFVCRNVDLSSIEQTVKLVVRECAGLPLLIKTVAGTFKSMKDNSALWGEGLRNLRRWPNAGVQGMDELIEVLKFSYDELGDDDTKVCFLYSALYAENCKIYEDHLLECWKAEDFISEREKGRGILRELTNRSLLEGSDRINFVKMHKVLRNMALQISSRSNNLKLFVRIPDKQRQPPKDIECQHVERISLMNNELGRLPEMKNCSNLSTLFLQKNLSLKVIHESFFEIMKNLRVLDLHDTRIELLPSSISRLTRLRALYLNSCLLLRELPICIEKLTCLEILDIRGTMINKLPIQIRSLKKLKCLRISFSNVGRGQSSDVEFGEDVLSSLDLLEELRINGHKDILELENVVKPITQKVASLNDFTSLSIFPLSKKNDHFTFQFSVGGHYSTIYQILEYFEYHQIRTYLKFVNGEGAPPAISEVLAETDAFELIGHMGAKNLSDFDIKSINKMRGCLIEGCNEIETIVDGDSLQESALEGLEVMCIYNVPKLASIWEGPVHAGSLARLKTLILRKCWSLKTIFSNGMIAQLSELQNLKVEECLEIEEIIMESENMGLEPVVLPSLKTLELLNLPKQREYNQFGTY
ncbi:disease resistance protein RPS2-like [Corylus avellana]|uniref:disease resistance protein RPS2-like n=1 Tax=Corylus avellana TaxID=13451 RepID=UPI00286AA0E8|nr:disease resistance protein RPS2-like [Corylus avellana]